MNLETIIQEKVHALPTFKQEKVLAFVENLESEKTETNGKPEKPTKKNDRAGWR